MDFDNVKGDITKCLPTNCIRKNICARFLISPHKESQTYYSFDKGELIDDDGVCEFFWDIDE